MDWVGEAGGEESGPVGDWGGSGTIGGGGIDGGGRGRTNPVGAKAGKEGRDIARVRERESFEGAVVVNVKAKKFGGDRVGFGVVKEGERVETRKSKSLRWWYLTPKSSTTNAKTMSRET